mmetsp:Transcript_32646/g.77434  ORF Transcript_32646/g.77434 Transcript_32646/m.77434 type:complete len:216 (-) Transcript_32646:1182-1829(-)
MLLERGRALSDFKTGTSGRAGARGLRSSSVNLPCVVERWRRHSAEADSGQQRRAVERHRGELQEQRPRLAEDRLAGDSPPDQDAVRGLPPPARTVVAPRAAVQHAPVVHDEEVALAHRHLALKLGAVQHGAKLEVRLVPLGEEAVGDGRRCPEDLVVLDPLHLPRIVELDDWRDRCEVHAVGVVLRGVLAARKQVPLLVVPVLCEELEPAGVALL